MNQQQPVILITGAARRIGAFIAQIFHAKGYQVIIHYHRSAAAADRLCEQLNATRPDSCALVQSDLNDMQGLQKIADLAHSVGRLDVLVNNASSFFSQHLLQTVMMGSGMILLTVISKAHFFSRKSWPRC